MFFDAVVSHHISIKAFVAQQVEHHHGKVGVTGSIPVKGSKLDLTGPRFFGIRQFLKIKKNNG